MPFFNQRINQLHPKDWFWKLVGNFISPDTHKKSLKIFKIGYFDVNNKQHVENPKGVKCDSLEKLLDKDPTQKLHILKKGLMLTSQ